MKQLGSSGGCDVRRGLRPGPAPYAVFALSVTLALACGRSKRDEALGGGTGTGGGSTTGGGTGGTGGTASGAGGTVPGTGGTVPGTGGTVPGTGGTAPGAGGKPETFEGSGGQPSDRCETEPSVLDGLSFDLTWVQGGDAAELPVIAHFDATPQHGIEIVFGASGQAYRTALESAQSTNFGSALVTTEPFTVFARPSDFGGNQEQVGVEVKLSSLALCARPGELKGSGSLVVTREYDDSFGETDAHFEFTSEPDRTAPDFDPPAGIDPLAPPPLPVNEPLRAGATARLARGDGTTMELVPIEEAGTVTGFTLPEILPLGFRGKLDGNGADLGGLSLVPSAKPLSTFDDPGVQPLDGFESALAAAVIEASPSVDGDPVLGLVTGARAISGAQSLSIPAGLTALLHLQRPVGASDLVFDLAAVVSRQTVEGEFLVRAGVVGGTQVATQRIPIPYYGETDDGSAGASGLGQRPAEPVRIPLGDAGSDVLLTIEAPSGALPQSVTAAATVDDIDFE